MMLRLRRNGSTTAAEWWSQESHPCVSISKFHAFKIFNQTILSDAPQAYSGSAAIATPTLDVRSAPMICTSLPSFSGATLWMLSGDTTSESPSAREVAVFSARPCEQSRVRITKIQCGLIWLFLLQCLGAGWASGSIETDLSIIQLEN